MTSVTTDMRNNNNNVQVLEEVTMIKVCVCDMRKGRSWSISNMRFQLRAGQSAITGEVLVMANCITI